MWYAKMYFSGEKEYFENDAFGMHWRSSSSGSATPKSKPPAKPEA